MTEVSKEILVYLRKSELGSFGFSLLGTNGLPHVIYDILEHSPAAQSGEVCIFSMLIESFGQIFVCEKKNNKKKKITSLVYDKKKCIYFEVPNKTLDIFLLIYFYFFWLFFR